MSIVEKPFLLLAMKTLITKSASYFLNNNIEMTVTIGCARSSTTNHNPSKCKQIINTANKKNCTVKKNRYSINKTLLYPLNYSFIFQKRKIS